MAGKSIAVWTKGACSEGQTHEVHVNYWRMGGGDSSWLSQHVNGLAKNINRQKSIAAGNCDLLELGIWVINPKNIDTVSLYVPIKIERKDVFDCSAYFKNSDISQAIFNEPITIAYGSQKSPIITAKINEDFYTAIFSFEVTDAGLISDTELELVEKGDGTQLCITSKAIRAAQEESADFKKLYFRIRVNLRGGSPFVSTIKPYDGALQSGYDEIDYIDFRVNETRSLPREVQVDLRRSSSKLKKYLS